MSASIIASGELACLFTAEEIETFQTHGYAIIRGAADAATREAMTTAARTALTGSTEPCEYEADLQYPGAPESRLEQGGNTVRRLLQAVARGPVFTRWIVSTAIAGRLNQLLQQQVVMPLAHHNCIMTKQPCFSSDTGWHQDIRYWSFARPELISVWLALGVENLNNGCLRLIPGSHRMSLAPDRFDQARFLREDLPENQELIGGSVAAELEPGDVLFFHCRTLHAATRNFTQQTKLSVVFTFRPFDNPPVPGTRSSSLPELLLPNVGN